ncbi:MAG TPA: nucleotidyltransferase [Deltaproteobacteria bacterium]|nr:nucleotidyltransferase [Deltaproteobacteria bacterium]
MERLRERITIAEKALKTFEEIMQIASPDLVTRDAGIQRFEYTFEAVWKTAQRFLLVKEGLTAGSPKSTIRASLQVGLLNETECDLALRMADDRNLTVHTYDESIAETLYQHLQDYYPLLQNWLEKIKHKTAQ